MNTGVLNEIIRCPWGDTTDALMREYHDKQWGKPCFDERTLFEMLNLEGAQAGLSWSTILHKREGYRAAFDNWDIVKVASYDDSKIAELLQNNGIIRNRLKVGAAITNAQAVIKLGSLREFIWSYVDGKPIINHWRAQEEMPATTPLSDQVSKDMKKLGFKFVGSTIIYSYLQAVGVVNDHIEDCAFRGETVITKHKLNAIRVREITPGDYPALKDFLYHAIFVPPGIEPLPRDIIYHPDVFVYIDGFGDKRGDCGVVAEVDGRIVGAAWERIIPAFGHIDDETPELAISVLPEYRGRAIGTMMMTRLFALLRERGYTQTSLAVQKENAAVRFYQRLGYETIRESDEEYIMVKDLIMKEG